MVRLAHLGVFTSQGVPFIFCGEEMFRSKLGEKNTYNMPDKYNAIDWSLKSEYSSLVEFAPQQWNLKLLKGYFLLAK